MSERSPKLLVLDMLDAVERILGYTDGLDETTFRQDRRTQDAVLYNLQVLGEAARRVPGEVRQLVPDIEWHRIIRSRHIVVHDYFGVDLTIVWRIVTVHLPPLHTRLEYLARRLEDDFGQA